MTNTTISLTDQIDITNGAHILYLYDSAEGYIQNAMAFILTGLRLGHHIVFIDDRNIYKQIMERLGGKLVRSDYDKIYYVDNREFYYCHHGFHVKNIMDNLEGLFNSFLEKKITVRSWGHVYWENQQHIFKLLDEYERLSDESMSELGIVGVCCYDARRISSSVQNELLKSHEYMMTDTSLVKSQFYHDEERTVHFPSLSVHSQLQSEVDLYKHKLEFAHVVSHEVRNPLTVIRAYATMLQSQVGDAEAVGKLKAIVDYVDVIDNEITHIINTEQMLSTESLWTKTIIPVRPNIEEVLPVMLTKSRTQNMKLYPQVELQNEMMLSNVMGLKLIVSNLLSNAIKYSLEGGRIWFRACHARGVLELIIKDEGIGMSPEQLEKLFRKYEKMNHEQSGQGIGLFMVKKLVDHFGGSIKVQSELNEGTEVTVKLPLLSG
ncbi:ATP-binding protein [Paenibacillus doosanensis]|uniref:ATP-binding protein n=1 Tax=Paenibacillus doosanensis TaxID=1229154 RepID=UPI002180490B|nr:ATP-binding protein [Paenibacillus doosanensis]MCS7459147.1 ATP-binding protein [Paenibacillus doosanensis]